MVRLSRLILTARHASIYLALIALQPSAYANQLQPVQSTLQRLVQTLTGPIATSLAILAVIAAGFLAFVGRLNWFFAGSMVFGSAQIVSFFQSAVGGGGGG
jgi:type IV secretion system protein VirB2